MYSVVRFTKINIKEVKIYYTVSRVNSGLLKIRAILDSPMFQAEGVCGVALLWLIQSKLRQLNYFTDPIRHLLA